MARVISESKRRAIVPWLSMGFCAVLSLLTIVANLWLSVVNHTDVGGWAIVFLCNLPLCFMFVGYALSQTQREVRELREEVARLRESRAA